MRTRIHHLLVERTGEDVDAWNSRIAEIAPGTEDEFRSWLGERGVTRHPVLLLSMETSGYPVSGRLC